VGNGRGSRRVVRWVAGGGLGSGPACGFSASVRVMASRFSFPSRVRPLAEGEG
jgi:hypothetical protein